MKKKRNAFRYCGSASAVRVACAMICEKRTARPTGSTAMPIRRLRLAIMIVRSLQAMVATFWQFISMSPRVLVVVLVVLAAEQLQVGLLQAGDAPADELD